MNYFLIDWGKMMLVQPANVRHVGYFIGDHGDDCLTDALFHTYLDRLRDVSVQHTLGRKTFLPQGGAFAKPYDWLSDDRSLEVPKAIIGDRTSGYLELAVEAYASKDERAAVIQVHSTEPDKAMAFLMQHFTEAEFSKNIIFAFINLALSE